MRCLTARVKRWGANRMGKFRQIISEPFMLLSLLLFTWGNAIGGRRRQLRMDFDDGGYLILNKFAPEPRKE